MVGEYTNNIFHTPEKNPFGASGSMCGFVLFTFLQVLTSRSQLAYSHI